MIENKSIQRTQFRQYFNKRFTKRVADILLHYIEFNGNFMKFEDYSNNVRKLMQLDYHEKLKIAFDMLDVDGDGRLSINDIMINMEKTKETDIMIMEDLEMLIKHLSNPNLESKLKSQVNIKSTLKGREAEMHYKRET